MLNNSSTAPWILQFSLLKKITDGFSEKRKVGSGGYGEVYMGKLDNGEEIAVKKLYPQPGLDDKQFMNEFSNLIKVQHENIVQLVGYCYDEQDEFVPHNGKLVLAQREYRMLCFEYLHGGSLDKHLYEEHCGLDWHTRYKIITGICEGLNYLHGLKESILHLGLKPANILLDKNMVPKIADFGFSRLFGETRTHITENCIGTKKYMPPEYIHECKISKKYDVFSLGVIIIEIMTGREGYSKYHETSTSEQFIELVHNKWKVRIDATSTHTSPEEDCKQVKRCIEIALNCVEPERHKRPTIGDIIHKLRETKTMPHKVSMSFSQEPGSVSSHFKGEMVHNGKEVSPGLETMEEKRGRQGREEDEEKEAMAAQVAAAAANGGSDGAVPVAAVGGVGVGVAQPLPTTSLYVGDLEASVTDSQLYDLFSQVGQVVSVRVCRDVNSRRSLEYAYVNFSNPMDAARALEVLNFAPLNNKPIRVMYANRDPSSRRSGSANIFIKNLDKTIDNKTLHDTFSAFGTILSCKVATDEMSQSKGFGFVQYEKEEAAQSAIKSLNGMLINDKPVYVGPFLRKQERENSVDKAKFNNVFVKNLSESTTKEDLVKFFGEYGNITSAVVMIGMDGKSRCFGFVNFESADDAARAVDELNGKKINDKEWYVGRAQKKSEREMELKRRFEQSMKDAADKYQGLNLYLKNLDDSIGDDQLRELFSNFGKITSCKVMHDQNAVSKGSGFVAFSTREEASHALTEMNGKMISGKPLYVAFAQRKEERKAMLQAQFSQMRPVPMTPSMAPRLPMYPPMVPLGQQLFYGQAPPAIMPPQPGFGFQQQLVPGMRPGGAHMPNYFVPVVQQGQQGPRPGIRRSGAGSAQGQQSAQSFQQQMLPRGRVYRYPPGRNMPDVPPMPGVASGAMMQPYDMGAFPVRDAGLSPAAPIGTLTSALANATPDQQRTILGESLYPLVEQLERNQAAKVTGMLLEMDQTEVLHLLESPEALKSKVAEAMDVLRNVAQQQNPNTPTSELAGLSLADAIIS